MKKVSIVVALVLVCATGMAQEKYRAKPSSDASQLEANVRKLWEAFKNKDKATLSAMLDDGFRQFLEGLTTFGDKTTEVNAPDDYELLSYTFNDFTIRPIGQNAALVTYVVQYEGKSGGEVLKGKSVFGEVWIRSGAGWKALYMQETYVK